MAKAPQGIFYDIREFLDAADVGQIDGLTLRTMKDILKPDEANLHDPDWDELSCLEKAVTLVAETKTDSQLRDLFDNAVKKLEQDLNAKKPKTPLFLILCFFKDGTAPLYLGEEMEYQDFLDAARWNQMEVGARIQEMTLLEELSRVEICPLPE